MANHGTIAGAGGMDVIFRHEADARNAGHGKSIAGIPVGTEFISERGPVRATNGDEVFKAALAKVYDNPQGLKKAEYVETETPRDATEAITGPAAVTDLIRKAMKQPGAIEDLERGYSGREQAALAKAAAPKTVTRTALDHASPILKEALSEFDQFVRSHTSRRPV